MSDLTIRDIARMAGVSTTAVSFVLNNKPGVSAATREHVQNIIRQTGFTPNVHTRRLNLGKSFTINVVLYWHQYDLFNQFALEITHGVFEACKQLGYSVIFTYVEDPTDCKKLMESIHSKDCDGLILSQIENPTMITQIQQAGIPFVCVDSHVKKDGSIPAIEVDYYNSARQGVQYLHANGHRRIGFICPATPFGLHQATFSGYMDALRDFSLVCDPAWIGSIDFSPSAAGAFLDRLLVSDRLPSAFLCIGDPFAIDLVQTARIKGLKIPDDLSIVSVDDLLVSRFISPPLSSMTFDKEALGREAVATLVQIIDHQEFKSVTLVPTSLAERGSVKKLL